MKTQKLWKVKVNSYLLVLAPDKQSARRDVIDSHIKDEAILNRKCVSVVHEVKSLGQVPPGWMDRLPYAKYCSRIIENKTVKEFINRKLFKSFRK